MKRATRPNAHFHSGKDFRRRGFDNNLEKNLLARVVAIRELMPEVTAVLWTRLVRVCRQNY
jgi:hypothetical protein